MTKIDFGKLLVDLGEAPGMEPAFGGDGVCELVVREDCKGGTEEGIQGLFEDSKRTERCRRGTVFGTVFTPGAAS